MLRSSVLLSQTLSVVHWAFLVSLPIAVDYLDRWAHRHQCHGHTTPWHRSTLDFRNCIHDTEIAWADLVELRVVYTRYPTGSTDRYSPAAVIKWNRLTGTTDTKAHFPSKFGSITILVLLPPTSIPSSKLFFHVVPDVAKKFRADWKQKSIQAATHDSVFGRARVVSLDIVRDVPLYRRRIMSAISCACAHSSPASSRTAMR
jgi:hypothetical protein